MGKYPYFPNVISTWIKGQIYKHLSTPSDNPPSGFVKLYFKSDGKLYKLDSSGTETKIDSTLTNAEVKTAYEANANSNEFDDAEQSKLAGISTLAEVNPDLISQVEAETGSDTTERIFNALRVKQAIDALSAGGSLWAVIGTYEASVAESSHIFNFTAIDFSNDSELMLVIDLQSNAVVDVLVQVNGNTTLYFSDGRRISGGTETLLDLNSQSGFNCGTALPSDRTFGCIVHIHLNASPTNYPVSTSMSHNRSEENQVMGGRQGTITASFTSVKVLLSASSWVSGARITLYRLKRAV